MLLPVARAPNLGARVQVGVVARQGEHLVAVPGNCVCQLQRLAGLVHGRGNNELLLTLHHAQPAKETRPKTKVSDE